MSHKTLHNIRCAFPLTFDYEVKEQTKRDSLLWVFRFTFTMHFSVAVITDLYSHFAKYLMETHCSITQAPDPSTILLFFACYTGKKIM